MKRRTVCLLLFAVVVSLITPPLAWPAGVPGFEIVRLTDEDSYKEDAAINNCGQIVYGNRHNNVYDHEEVYLYENGVTTRLTNDTVNDRLPDINDQGIMVWMRRVGAGRTAEIAVYNGSTIGLLTLDALDDYSPKINNAGNIVWCKWNNQGCEASDVDIMFYDGTTTHQITDGGFSRQSPSLNDLDEIVWTRYDFCQSPWVSDIQLYSGGQITTLTSGELEPQSPSIAFNELTGLTQAAWRSEHPNTSYFVRLWDSAAGPTTLLDPSGGPQINSYGEITMGAPGQGVHSAWQVWLYRSDSGQYIQVTDTVDVNTPRDINDYGEIVMTRKVYPYNDVYYLRRIRNGDVDLDFDVDLDDYFEWSDCWTGPLETDGLCHCRFIDMEHDRDIDMADFAAFQNAFGQPVD